MNPKLFKLSANWAGLFWFGASLGFVTHSASGAESADIEEVVVTARKREERLQDIPGSAAALTGSMIEDIGGIYSLRDVTDQIPGITIVEGFSSDLMEPSIRGAGQSRNRSSVSATGFYRNGAYFASQSLGGRSFARMDTYDVQQIEVLRGPQGALYGRNALGGAMNIISHRPEKDLDFKVGVKGGQKDYQAYDLIANVPVSDTFQTRFSYQHDEREDGFFDDQFGKPVDVTEFDHVRVGLLFEPTDAWKIYYSYDRSDETYYPGVNQRVRATQTDLRQTLINTKHEGQHEINNHALTIEYVTEKGIFSSVTNQRDRDIDRREDDDFFVANVNAATNGIREQDTLVDADVFFQELRWVSTLGGQFEYLIGADYYTNTSSEHIDDFSPGSPTIATSVIRDWETDNDSWAVYGSLDYNFSSLPLSLSAELRYARDEISGYVITRAPNFSAIPILDVTSSNDFTNVPWGVTVSWHHEGTSGALTEAISYFKVGSSYRHGGINLGAGLPTDRYPTVPVYDEEDSISYEIGVKSGWFDGRVKLNASAYYVYYQDFLDTTTNGCPQECPFLDPVTNDSLGYTANGDRIEVTPGGAPGNESPTAFFVDNVGEIEAWGVEVETSFNFPVGDNGARFQGNVGWARQLGEVTEISSSVSPAQANELGARLNYIRPTQIKGNLTWRQPVGFIDGAIFKATTTYIHENGGVRNLSVNGGTMDGVDRMDIRVGLETNHWSFTLNGNNVLDNEYFIDRTATRFRLVDPEYYFFELTYRYQ